MSDEISPTPQKKKKKKRKRPLNIEELRTNARLVTEAVKKASDGIPLTEQEYFALYKSAIFSASELDSVLSQIPNIGELALDISTPELYVEQPEIVHGYLDLWAPNVELEMLEHFRQNPHELYNLSPRKFEELVASIFKNNGFNVQLTPETRDGGIDIIAVQHSAFTGETVNLIECKRYGPSHKVGIGIVQRMLGCVYERRANKGIVITTSFFSRDAMHVASNHKHQLVLNDYNNLTSWLSGLEKWNKVLKK